MDEATLKMSEILKELELLRKEMEVVFTSTRKLWDTDADQDHRHFPNTIYGFVMAAMAKVDYLSKHWIWNEGRQTERMIEFMNSFLGYDKGASKIAVHFFRHKLMHTSNVLELHDDQGKSYRWLLHHGDGSDLPRDRHMLLNADKLDFGLLYLVEDLISAVPRLAHSMGTDREILGRWARIESKMRSVTK